MKCEIKLATSRGQMVDFRPLHVGGPDNKRLLHLDKELGIRLLLCTQSRIISHTHAHTLNTVMSMCHRQPGMSEYEAAEEEAEGQ